MPPLSTYLFSFDASGLVYTFISNGVRRLTKKVIFTAINSLYYNVELRTEEDNVLLPDTENSNNGDIFLVLNTCAAIVRHFIDTHPDNAIYIKGSDAKRQRHYQRMLSNALKENSDLKVFGERIDGKPELFQDGITYEACLIFRSQ